MLHILSIGAAYPGVSRDTNEVCELCGADSAQRDEALSVLGEKLPENRHFGLSAEYIKTTLNQDVFRSAEGLEVTPTDLSLRAAEQAMQRAGIQASDIGLVIGATQTPLETTPFESQRVAKALGIKVPAFDVQTGAADIFSQMLLLSRWKAEELPDYVLLVSSSEASMHINFQKGVERFFFGDGASVAVVSAKHKGIWSVVRGHRAQDVASLTYVDLDMLGYMSADLISFVEFCEQHDAELLKELESGVSLVPALGTPDFLRSKGYLLGAHSAACVESLLYGPAAEHASGSRMVLSLAGTGGGRGRLEIERS